MVRDEIAEALRGLTVDELLETRRYIDRLLTRLQDDPGAQRPPAPDGHERRRFSRYSVNLQVTYFRHASASNVRAGPSVRDAVVRDISRGGIRFFAADPLERQGRPGFGKVAAEVVGKPVGVEVAHDAAGSHRQKSRPSATSSRFKTI